MFTEQFKIILWKNWKIFKRRSSLFSCFFEIFFTFLILATLCKFSFYIFIYYLNNGYKNSLNRNTK